MLTKTLLALVTRDINALVKFITRFETSLAALFAKHNDEIVALREEAADVINEAHVKADQIIAAATEEYHLIHDEITAKIKSGTILANLTTAVSGLTKA